MSPSANLQEQVNQPMPLESQPESSKKIPFSVWIIGWMMFLINLSFVIMYSLSAVYLKNVVGVSTAWIGFLEGFVEAASYAAKLLSGVISDYLRRRKFIMVIGYILLVISRPVLAMASNFGLVFTARTMERIGNGIQATPRDALVGDIAPKERRGASFGLKRSLGTAGSFVGGIVAMLAMIWTSSDYQTVFWIATIPAFIAFFILLAFVKEPKRHAYPQKLDPSETVKPPRQKIRMSDLSKLGRDYWLLMVVIFLFMLARFSETLLMLHANQNYGLSEAFIPMIMVLYNATYSLSSYPMGALSDRKNRHLVLGLGIAILIASDVVLFSAPNIFVLFLGVALWGLQIGATQGVSVALIIDSVPENLRGTALGVFYLISSVASIVAGAGAGTIAEIYGEGMAFLTSSIVAIFAILFLFAFMPKHKKSAKSHG